LNSDNECEKCHKNCSSCKNSGDNNCTSCIENRYSDSDNTVYSCPCVEGFSEVGGECVRCHFTCKTCSDNKDNGCTLC